MATDYCVVFDMPADRVPLPGVDLLAMVGIPLIIGLAMWWFHRKDAELSPESPTDTKRMLDAQKGRALGLAAILLSAVIFVLGMPSRVYQYVSVRRAITGGEVRSVSGLVEDYRLRSRGHGSFVVGGERFTASRYTGQPGFARPELIRNGIAVRVGFVEHARDNVIVRLEVDSTEDQCGRSDLQGRVR